MTPLCQAGWWMGRGHETSLNQVVSRQVYLKIGSEEEKKNKSTFSAKSRSSDRSRKTLGVVS
jgi:hypothetical protein